MGETGNIAKMAEMLSSELFSEFFWKKVGPINKSWACEDKILHGVNSHPSDIVFFYDEPYSPTRTYINCDLKSYAKASITTSAIQGAIESLAKQVACAEKSDEWRDYYLHEHVSPQICGLLFIYNHDGEYDRNFKQHLNSIKTEKLDFPKGTKLIVLGPKDIYWLNNVCHEIIAMRGSNKLPEAKHCSYFYPQLVRTANVQLGKARAATLEMLTSPWIVLEHKVSKGEGRRGIVVFYRRKGEETKEFIYLIDYLRQCQVLREDTDIQIKCLDAVPTFTPSFQKAVHQYTEEISYGSRDGGLSKCVRAIKYSTITHVVPNFSEIEVGMDYD